MTAKRILITGANGLLGRALMLRLQRDSQHLVIGMDRSQQVPPVPNVHVANLLDSDALSEMCGQHHFTTIVHCGGVSGRAVARDNPLETITTNVVGTVNVFEAARKFAIERVVLCSSGSVYGRLEDSLVREDALLRPVNAYGASKIAAEAIMHAYREEWGVSGLALRLFQVFGPRRTTRCNIKTMVAAASAGREAFVAHGPDARCQYIYIDDAVDALMSAVTLAHVPRRIYNISGGTSLTLREVADAVSQALPGLQVKFGDDPGGREYCLRDIDLSAAKQDLGFVPKYSLAAGAAAYAQWMKTAEGQAFTT